MPVASQNAILHAATIERKAHMRTPVVQGVHSILFIDDQDRSMRSVYQEPSLVLEFLQRACTDEYVCLCFRRCHWIHEHFGLVLH